MKRKTFLSIAVALMLVAAASSITHHVFGQANANKESPQSNGSNELAGTWLTRITPPPEGPPAFQGIFSFIGDGSLIATQAGSEFPALGNPQLGLWSKDPSGKRRFTLTYYGQDFDDHFQLTDSYRVRGTVTLNSSGTAFTGTVDITVYDLDGNEVFTDCCAAFEGNRAGLSSPAANANEFYFPKNRHAGWLRRVTKPRP